MFNKLFSQKAIYYFLTVIVFILVLYFSTNIVLIMRGLYIEKIQIDNIPEENNNIAYELYFTNISDNVDGEVEIAGYAYMETEQENPEKRIDLLLVSSKDTYLVPTTLSLRHDLSAEITGKKIQGNNHSFSGKFSYFLLSDGIYRLALHCYENDYANGYVYLKQYFIKNGRSFQISVVKSFNDISVKVNSLEDLNVDSYNDILSEPLPWHYLSFVGQDGIYMSFTGWIAVPFWDSYLANSFIAFKDEQGNIVTYTTTSYESTELEETVGTSLINNGFFNSCIPIADFLPGEYTVELFAQYPGLTVKPEISHKIIITDDKKVSFVSGFGE